MKRGAKELALVAFCGLYCGDCFWRRGRVTALARKLGDELGRSGFDRFARYIARYPAGRAYRDYAGFAKVLEAMTQPGCHRPCRRGGCDPDCSIRACAVRRGLDGCWQCPGFARCPQLKALVPIHGAGYRRNLKRLATGGPAALVRGPRWWAGRLVRGRAAPARQ